MRIKWWYCIYIATTTYCNLFVILPDVLYCRWNELIRKIILLTEVHELNEQGTYAPVELQTKDATECGGIFQLRQGFSRRVVVQVSAPKQGQLPVVLERIKGISIGSVNVRAKIQKGLDSYQERDLQRFEYSVFGFFKRLIGWFTGRLFMEGCWSMKWPSSRSQIIKILWNFKNICQHNIDLFFIRWFCESVFLICSSFLIEYLFGRSTVNQLSSSTVEATKPREFKMNWNDLLGAIA